MLLEIVVAVFRVTVTTRAGVENNPLKMSQESDIEIDIHFLISGKSTEHIAVVLQGNTFCSLFERQKMVVKIFMKGSKRSKIL